MILTVALHIILIIALHMIFTIPPAPTQNSPCVDLAKQTNSKVVISQRLRALARSTLG